jgi:hypothetical protein
MQKLKREMKSIFPRERSKCTCTWTVYVSGCFKYKAGQKATSRKIQMYKGHCRRTNTLSELKLGIEINNHVRPSRTNISGLEPSFMVTIFSSQNYSSRGRSSRDWTLLSPGEGSLFPWWIWGYFFWRKRKPREGGGHGFIERGDGGYCPCACGSSSLRWRARRRRCVNDERCVEERIQRVALVQRGEGSAGPGKCFFHQVCKLCMEK